MARVVIVGSNRGIGLEMARRAAGRGDKVVACCRSASDALRDLEVELVEGVDVTTEEGLQALAAGVGVDPIEVLVVVAGILRRVGLDELDLDTIREQFEVNAVGPLRVVHALRSRLGQGSRVGLVTSRMGSVADNTSGGHYGYRMSKAALNMAGKSLAVDLAEDGVAVALLHPGYVRTDMTGGQGFIDPEESAAGLWARMDELDAASSGTFWHMNGEVLPW
jgi:NAD(P)-dependent dehydrogenase (short-subunit alcohol dehydrogenase family)